MSVIFAAMLNELPCFSHLKGRYCEATAHSGFDAVCLSEAVRNVARQHGGICRLCGRWEDKPRFITAAGPFLTFCQGCAGRFYDNRLNVTGKSAFLAWLANLVIKRPPWLFQKEDSQKEPEKFYYIGGGQEGLMTAKEAAAERQGIRILNRRRGYHNHSPVRRPTYPVRRPTYRPERPDDDREEALRRFIDDNESYVHDAKLRCIIREFLLRPRDGTIRRPNRPFWGKMRAPFISNGGVKYYARNFRPQRKKYTRGRF